MVQEVGETAEAIIEEDEKHIQKILDANKNRTEPYWIVIFARPEKLTLQGKPVLNKFIKAYANKPRMQVGMICGEVDNKTSNIKWEVSMPDKPFGFEVLGLTKEDAIVCETSIPQSYVYN